LHLRTQHQHNAEVADMRAEVDTLEEWVEEQGMLGELGDILPRLQQGRLHLPRRLDPEWSTMRLGASIMDRFGMQTHR
jgi:hypothetical protein